MNILAFDSTSTFNVLSQKLNIECVNVGHVRIIIRKILWTKEGGTQELPGRLPGWSSIVSSTILLKTESWLYQLLTLSDGVRGPGEAEAPERFLQVEAGGDPGGRRHLRHGSTAGRQAVAGR